MPNYTCEQCSIVIARTPEVNGHGSQGAAVVLLNQHAIDTGHTEFTADSPDVRILVNKGTPVRVALYNSPILT